ncbi:uncharacterized protein LOC584740 [Strongylocentrotus purpuratus]|uniref:THAP-type domain-containing protein n=1 Tax=Strongylocentrotus purpuratus TaxID=7668 RepID=A0A7M7TH00_STRPU|nr:uncharacterized protein LOC584740 [Strongylocentrotus purpuratus]|eukprot:XP_789683.1 PREDICTED: uncharacterized protein LOC584740 [Strongylocentrotus purpuratus]
MGGGDRCAVYGCNNDRRYPERYVVKDHVNNLRFHKCTDPRNYAQWTRLLNRDMFQVTSSTRICSNHFQHGQPYPDNKHPSLHLKGYEAQPKTPSRAPPKLRDDKENVPPQPSRRDKKSKSVGVQVNPTDFDITQSSEEHNYANSNTSPQVFSQAHVNDIETQLHEATSKCEVLKQTVNDLAAKVTSLEKTLGAKKRFGIEDISSSDDLIKFYTGIPTYQQYKWLMEQVHPRAVTLHYFKGKSSLDDKNYQVLNHQKPGKKRSQSLEDELLMTLMKLRLNLREEDLAFRFGVSQSTVSLVLSTWIPFLSKELESFILWPSQEDTHKYYPNCFNKFHGTVRCIIDCTEIQIDRPTLAGSHSQVYSQYKARPTLKCLVGITPGGTISFVSKPAGGNTSDKKLVKMSNIIDKFEKGDTIMADRGFNIQDLLLEKQVKVVIPPFMRTTKATNQFTESEDVQTKTVANARIHVERAIGRMKEFGILQGPIPLTMIDLMESALVVCSAIVNMQPMLVPLNS